MGASDTELLTPGRNVNEPLISVSTPLNYPGGAGPSAASTPFSAQESPASPTKSALKAKNEEMRKKFIGTLKKLMSEKFSIVRFLASDEQIRLYTGFKSYSALYAFFKFLHPDCLYINYLGSKPNEEKTPTKRRGGVKKLLLMDEFFMTLIRLRQNLPIFHLANLFGLSNSQTGRIINSWILFLKNQFEQLDIWPPLPPQEKLTFPKDFEKYYEDLFSDTIAILDCTEMNIQRASASNAQRETFSSYKHRVTMKALVGIDLAGTIIYGSELYAGRTSDKKLFNDCGIIDQLKPGDAVMVDKGFLIAKECEEQGVRVHIPHFKDKNNQFTADQVKFNQALARVRVHVERAIRQIKEFKILSCEPIPLSLAPMLDHIWFVCWNLTNFIGPLIDN